MTKETPGNEGEEPFRRFARLISSTPDSISLVNREYIYLLVNDAYVRRTGRQRAEIIGHSMAEVVGTAVFQELIKPHFDRCLTGETVQYRGLFDFAGTGPRSMNVTYLPYRDETAVVTAVQVNARDLTEIAQRDAPYRPLPAVEEAEREQHLLAQTLMEISDTLNISLDLNQVLERVLAVTRNLIPHDGANIMLLDDDAKTVTVVQHCDCYANNGFQAPTPGQPFELAHFPHLMTMLQTGGPIVIPDTAVCPTWQTIAPAHEIRSYLAAPLVVHDRPVGILNLDSRQPNFYDDRYRDRLQALTRQAAIAIHNAQLYARQRDLTRQIVTGQEEERRRLAYELHDDAGQALTALKIGLELLSGNLVEADPAIRAQVEEIKAVAVETAVRIRQIAHGLRPPALDAIGLNRTLAGLCRDQANLTGLSIVYTGRQLSGIPDPIRISLYRVCQEALTNVLRHAQASQVHVTLDADDQHIFLTITDNGQGFNERTTQLPVNQKAGLGLTAARERVEQLDGQFIIQTSPGTGACIKATIPWRR